MTKELIVLLFFSVITSFTLTNTKLAEAHRTIVHHRMFSYTPWGYGLGYPTNLYGYRSYYGYGYYYPYLSYERFPLFYPDIDPFFYSRHRAPIYYSPLINLPLAQPIYIQQIEPTIVQENQYWYYCEKPAGYYPKVKECQTEWIRVPPQPTE